MEAKLRSKILFVHDWLTGMRGGEKCLEVACRYWIDAPLYTLLHQPKRVSAIIENRTIRTSFLQRLPHVHRYYRYLLPIMPWAINWRLPSCDAVLSFSHCVAKSVQPPPGTPHICYCFSPMRYAWHMQQSYFGENRVRGIKAQFVRRLLERMRDWDRRTAKHVTHFIAISRTIQQRIQDCYQRDSVVIHPPVDTDFYTPSLEQRDDYYLVVSAFAPYKRIDLAIAACQKLGKKLVIIGTGQDRKRLEQMAQGNIQFLGWQSNEVIRDHLRKCRALLFPGEEDFGIVPVEANACGTPVIAFGRGGITDSIVPLGKSLSPTGIWFEEQTADSLITAIKWFEKEVDSFDATRIRKQAVRFDSRIYQTKLVHYIESVLNQKIEPVQRKVA